MTRGDLHLYWGLARESDRQGALDQLSALTTRLQIDQAACFSRLAVGPPMRLVRSAARIGEAPAILVAAPPAQLGVHPLGRALAEQALEQTDFPLIVAPQRVEQAWSVSHAVRVLVPLDGSRGAECAVAQGRLLGSSVERELLMLRVAPDGEARRLGDARHYLEQQAAGSEVGLAVLGDPSTMIAAVARAHRADLIVLTMHARTRQRQSLLGHVIVHVLQHAHVPVLLVRPAGDGSC